MAIGLAGSGRTGEEKTKMKEKKKNKTQPGFGSARFLNGNKIKQGNGLVGQVGGESVWGEKEDGESCV